MPRRSPPTYQAEMEAMRAARARRYRQLVLNGFQPNDALTASAVAGVELKSEEPDVLAVALCPECGATGHQPYSREACALCRGTGLAPRSAGVL